MCQPSDDQSPQIWLAGSSPERRWGIGGKSSWPDRVRTVRSWVRWYRRAVEMSSTSKWSESPISRFHVDLSWLLFLVTWQFAPWCACRFLIKKERVREMGVTKLTRTFSATSSPSMSPSSGSLRNKLQPEWRPDAASDSCLCCGQQFSLWCRRHHCRACGELVCAECSPHTELLPEYGYDTPVRVCKQCTGVSSASATTVSSPSPSEGLSDGELGEIDDDLVIAAVEVIASHSSHKHSKLAYEYFVQSEAVSWLVDAGVVKNRSTGVALFTRIADDGYVTMKPWKGTTRTAFYILNDVACQESRRSHYNGVMRSETAKCSNCSQSYLESLAPTPGFCSIDCKTNALISAADSARIRRYM